MLVQLEGNDNEDCNYVTGTNYIIIVRLDFINVLVEAGGDPLARDNNNKGAREIATFYKHEDIVQKFGDDGPFGRHK